MLSIFLTPAKKSENSVNTAKSADNSLIKNTEFNISFLYTTENHVVLYTYKPINDR